MSTHPANEQLSAYLDGELEEAEAASVEAALSGDAELREQLEKLKRVQQLLRDHGRARAPEGFAARVMEAARAEDKVVAFPWWRRPFGIPVEGVLVAAAAALVLVVALPKADPVEGPAREAPAAAVEEAKKAAPAGANADDAVADADEGTAEGLATGEGTIGGTKNSEVAQGSAPPVKKTAPTKAAPEALDAGGEADEALAKGGMDNAALPVAGSAAGTAEAGAGEAGTADPRDPVLAAAQLTGEIYTEDEAILGTLQAVVARHGGVIRDQSGKVVDQGVLEAGETMLLLDVAQSQASSLKSALSELGFSIETTGSEKLMGGGSAKIPVRIVVIASEPSTQQAAPPKASKKRMQYDEAYEAETVDQ